MVSWPSVRSHLTTSLNLRYRPLRCFCSREEQKDSTMMSCSQLHPCVLLLLPVVYSEAAQPAIGRLWSRPHGAPSVSEAWHYNPALRRQTKTRRSIVTVQEEDRRQNTGMRSPTPSDLSLSWASPPSHPWTWTQSPRRTTTADATSSRRVWQPSCFHSFFISVWCSCSNCCQILPANKWLLLESDANQNLDWSRFPTSGEHQEAEKCWRVHKQQSLHRYQSVPYYPFMKQTLCRTTSFILQFIVWGMACLNVLWRF